MPASADQGEQSTWSGRSAVEPATMLLAIERVGADVTALGRALASQPEEVAARLDVDAATASIGVRVGALGSALDQLRLSLLASLDRTTERVDAPVWLPSIQAALADIGPRLDEPAWAAGLPDSLGELQRSIAALSVELERSVADAPGSARVVEAIAALGIDQRLDVLSAVVARIAEDHRLDELTTTVARIADDDRLDRLDQLTATVARIADDDRLDQLTATVARIADDNSLDQLSATVARIADDDRIDSVLAAVAAADPGSRLASLERSVAELADGVRAGAAVGDALEQLGQRLASIEDAAARVADDARILVERVTPVPDRLSAIASQVDRITPLARAGDQAGSLFDRLDQVASGLAELLRARAGSSGGEDGDDERFEGVVDVLSGVTRRQDQVTAAIASVLDQVRGPKGVDAVLERMEQRERSLAARLDRIDGELRRQSVAGGERPTDEGTARPDAETTRALETVVLRLDQIDAELRGLRETSAGDSAGAPLLKAVLERMQQQERTVGRHLDWVGERLAEVASHLVPDEGRPAEDRLEAVADLVAGVAQRQDELASALTALAEDGRDPRHVADELAAVAHRQDELAAAIASLVDQVRGPIAVDAVFDRMEQRERSLAARLDRIDIQLRRRGEGAPTGGDQAELLPDDAAASLAASVEAIAAVTENLAALVESTTSRLDRRVAGLETTLGEVRAQPVAPASTPPAASAEDAALRLAKLRAERAEVQARLQEERLLAARAWEDELE
jgi:hypothetical protein